MTPKLENVTANVTWKATNVTLAPLDIILSPLATNATVTKKVPAVSFAKKKPDNALANRI